MKFFYQSPQISDMHVDLIQSVIHFDLYSNNLIIMCPAYSNRTRNIAIKAW